MGVLILLLLLMQTFVIYFFFYQGPWVRKTVSSDNPEQTWCESWCCILSLALQLLLFAVQHQVEKKEAIALAGASPPASQHFHELLIPWVVSSCVKQELKINSGVSCIKFCVLVTMVILWCNLYVLLMGKDLDLFCYSSIPGCNLPLLSCEDEKATDANSVPCTAKPRWRWEQNCLQQGLAAGRCSGTHSEPATSWVTRAALAGTICGALLEAFPRGLSWEGPGKSSTSVRSLVSAAALGKGGCSSLYS